MADVRCPICGKSNPADTETCRYCGARLKPLTNSTDSSSQGETTSSKAQKTDADWLGALRGQQEVHASASNQGVFVPGPLSQSSTGKGEPENSLNTPDEDFSSWLSRIGAEESLGENSDAPVEKTPGAPTSGGTDDWLASLREIPAGRDPEKNDLYPSGLNGQGNQDDSSWMNRLEPVSHESSSDSGFNFSIPEEPVAPSDEDLPAWLKNYPGVQNPSKVKPRLFHLPPKRRCLIGLIILSRLIQTKPERSKHRIVRNPPPPLEQPCRQSPISHPLNRLKRQKCPVGKARNRIGFLAWLHHKPRMRARHKQKLVRRGMGLCPIGFLPHRRLP